MKSGKLFTIVFFFSALLLMCGKKSSPTNSADKPPAYDISGTWNILITVTGGEQMPIGEKITATLLLTQSDNGDVTGSSTAEGGLTSVITGEVSDVNFNFVFKQDIDCRGTFRGSGTISENGRKLDGNYSGTDCNGTMKASFSSTYFKPAIKTGTVTDIDGNTYKTITIDNQWWMAENLKVTHYRNGNAIPNVTDSTMWSNLTTGAYCNYNNDVNNVSVYGRLYNWYAVNDNRNIAPSGWHVPTETDWQTLIDYLGGVSVAGGKLKETGTTHWTHPNNYATNESGFTALPGGRAPISGFEFLRINVSAAFWSSTEVNEDALVAWGYSLFNKTHPYLPAVTGGAISPWDDEKYFGFSVRCVRD